MRYYFIGALIISLAALVAVGEAAHLDPLGAGSYVSWNNTFYNKTVSGVADGVVFVTSLDYKFGGFTAKIQAIDARTGLTLWTNESFGEREIPLSFYSFKAVPNIVFFLQSNTNPARLVAYHSRNGSVIWSLSNAVFTQGPNVLAPNVLASSDGTVIFAISNIKAKAVSIERSTGTVLVSSLEGLGLASGATVFPVLCGANRPACLASLFMFTLPNGTHSIELRLINGRTGSYMAMPLPHFPAYYSIWGEGDVLLLVDRSQSLTTRLSTTDLVPMWEILQTLSFMNPVVIDYVNTTTGKHSKAIVGFGSSYPVVIALDAGASLPEPIPWVICPTGSPAPSTSAYSFGSVTASQFASGQVAATLQCQYSTNNGLKSVYIYAVFDVTNMTAPTWWRYTSAWSTNAFIVVDSKHFLLVNEYELATVSTADVYQSAKFTPTAQYLWSSLPYGETYNTQPLVGWTTNDMILLQQTLDSPPNSFSLAAIEP